MYLEVKYQIDFDLTFGFNFYVKTFRDITLFDFERISLTVDGKFSPEKNHLVVFSDRPVMVEVLNWIFILCHRRFSKYY